MHLETSSFLLTLLISMHFRLVRSVATTRISLRVPLVAICFAWPSGSRVYRAASERRWRGKIGRGLGQ